MGSWGPGKARVPHPSDWELFLYYRPGLGLVTPLAPVPVRHSQGCGAGPLFPYPRWPDTQAENQSAAWLQTRAGAFFGEGWGEAAGFHTHPSCGPRQAGASLGAFRCTGRAQGGRDVREHE